MDSDDTDSSSDDSLDFIGIDPRARELVQSAVNNKINKAIHNKRKTGGLPSIKSGQ